jgi:xanthine dehydrogenase large subunit
MLAGGCGMSPDLSDAIVDRAMFHCDNAYFVPAMSVAGHRVKTHTVSNTAFRGFGGPQGMLAIEDIIDAVARAPVSTPWTCASAISTASAAIATSPTTDSAWSRRSSPCSSSVSSAHIRLPRTARRITAFNRENPVLRRGIALTPVKFGISFTVKHLNQAGALLHVYSDGSIQINHGGTEMGQGLYTKVAQVVASELQVDLDASAARRRARTRCPIPRRRRRPPAVTSTAWRPWRPRVRSASDCSALRRTFRRSHEDAVRFSATASASASRHSFRRVRQPGLPTPRAAVRHGFLPHAEDSLRPRARRGRPFYYYANGAAVSEVLVDTLTGEYRVERVDICHDVGPLPEPGDRYRPDRGRLHPGHGLADQRGAGLG